MTKRIKSRAELHLEFIKECRKDLRRNFFCKTHHEPLDLEIDRIESTELIVNDLFKVKGRVYIIKEIVDSLVYAVDVQTKTKLIIEGHLIEKIS